MNQPAKKYLSKKEALERLRNWCAYQERSHAEVRKKLLSFGQRGDAAEEIISVLIEENFLNESRYAAAFSGGKFRMKNWGKRKIESRLKLQGVSERTISDAMKKIDEADYRATLKKVLDKKLKSLPKGLKEFERNRKTAAYAIGKGFEAELVWAMLKPEF